MSFHSFRPSKIFYVPLWSAIPSKNDSLIIDVLDGGKYPYHPWDWYIYLHLVDFSGKCRQIYHTWMLWGILSMLADAAHCKHMSNTSWALQCFMNLSCSNHSQKSPYSTRAHPLCNLLYLFFLCNWVVVKSTSGWFTIDTYYILYT